MYATPMPLPHRSSAADAMPLWRGLAAGAIPSLAAWVAIVTIARHFL
ncbi:hypothetical protein [Sphingomonas sp.]|jgi:hypothetical protein